tara:strand:- start:403 stop:1026 length:624 start_codon:yes stop_codon:yes gene_type:complete
MSANSVDSDSYVDGSIDTIHIGATQVTGAKLNNDVISAQTELAVAPADTDEFMVSDGGVLKRIDYSLIKSAGIDCDADAWARVSPVTDQDSAAVVDFTTSIHLGSNVTESGGVITVATAGWYLVNFHFSNQSAFSDTMNVYLRKNDSRVLGTIYWEGNTEVNYLGVDSTVLVECAATDTLDIYGSGYWNGNTNSESKTWFTGVRLGA